MIITSPLTISYIPSCILVVAHQPNHTIYTLEMIYSPWLGRITLTLVIIAADLFCNERALTMSFHSHSPIMNLDGDGIWRNWTTWYLNRHTEPPVQLLVVYSINSSSKRVFWRFYRLTFARYDDFCAYDSVEKNIDSMAENGVWDSPEVWKMYTPIYR